MTIQLPTTNFSIEQRELWDHVDELWNVSMDRDESKIRSTLHPNYVGWDMNNELPHDREAAVHSVLGDSPQLRAYDLRPLSVQIYEGKVGIVHYSYSATVEKHDGQRIEVTGKWSETYLKQNGAWKMISVSGKPDSER